ncbi:MAG: hypothetical protein M0010_21810 [Actinomycetota bacterium]|nr:hypothetical protein [Actinomycetota bacterium]
MPGGPQIFGDVGIVSSQPTGPTHWPSVPAIEAAVEWQELREWVNGLEERFHLDRHVLPLCWFEHNGHVEVLVALRDHERSCFAEDAPPSAALDWIRGLRDVVALLRLFSADLSCGSAHEEAPATCPPDPEEWERFVQSDVACRQHQEIQAATLTGIRA